MTCEPICNGEILAVTPRVAKEGTRNVCSPLKSRHREPSKVKLYIRVLSMFGIAVTIARANPHMLALGVGVALTAISVASGFALLL